MMLHSSLSCYIATGFAVAGVYAVGMLRGRRDAYHASALGIALAVGGVTAVAQPLSGDLSARTTARYQPAKLAAMEAHFETADHVGILVGGIPDEETRTVRWGVRIPWGLSLLVGHDPATVVRGLEEFPEDEWPNVLITHLAFQVMVGCGFALMAIAAWFWIARRRGTAHGSLLLRVLVLASPLGFLALEAGWLVTEVGRQPWVIYGVLRTRDGVTPVAEVPFTFLAFTVLYLALGAVLAYLLRKLAPPPSAPPAASRSAPPPADAAVG
jgi:cytochrome d ubiquinol oxidase subunit I